MARFSLNGLGSNPQLIACLPDASFNDNICVEAPAHFADIEGHSLELERRCPRDHLQPCNVRERVDDFFADPITEVALLRVRAHVHERQYSNTRSGRLDCTADFLWLASWMCIQ